MTDEERSERAWELFEQGDLESALAECSKLDPGDPERWLLECSVRTSLGEFDAARAAVERGREAGARDEDGRWPMARAEFALQAWCLEEAEREFRLALGGAHAPDACSGLGVVFELRGEFEEADRQFAAAHRLDPEGYPAVRRIETAAFEAVIHEAIGDLPPEFQALLEESEVIVAPTPGRELVVEGAEEETPPELLGLFCGASRLERSDELCGAEPSVIYLFQRNLERATGDLDELREQIRITLYHELGHLLGFDEEGVEGMGLA